MAVDLDISPNPKRNRHSRLVYTVFSKYSPWLFNLLSPRAAVPVQSDEKPVGGPDPRSAGLARLSSRLNLPLRTKRSRDAVDDRVRRVREPRRGAALALGGEEREWPGAGPAVSP